MCACDVCWQVACKAPLAAFVGKWRARLLSLTEVSGAGEWTISFWFKGSKEGTQLGVGVDLWLTLYSSIAPPIPLLRLVSYYGVLLFQVRSHTRMTLS